ncbi:sensor histidine kinase [Candidatus Poriferisocius sp.]|uniref:sensor histidine kinase n=1 Tax=Candidatus Poriferisocius sp. TaxID=3101276 RepID=UPI003B59E65C
MANLVKPWSRSGTDTRRPERRARWWRRAVSRARRLRLRTRIILAFVFTTLLLSALLSVTVFAVTRQNLLNGRENDALATVGFNASVVNRRLSPDIESEALQNLVSTLATPEGSRPVLRVGGDWFQPSFEFEQGDINERLRRAVESGSPARMRYRVRDKPFFVVGIPIPGHNASYYEATPLDEIEDTLGSLGILLASAGGGVTLASAGLGFWASRRVLRPLVDIGEAARSIAHGDLSTRLEAGADRELIALTDSFNEMVSALQDRIARDERFASEVSHELRSPLMTLSASVEVMNTRRAELPERARTALDLLTEDVDRFEHLVEDLLEISRFDVGTAELDLDVFNVLELVENAVAATSTEAIPITCDPAAARVRVRADKRRLVQVIDNLVNNAQKYAGGATGIFLRYRPRGIEIAVEDAGPGVDLDERERIFDRFSRGRRAGERGATTGVGLGLALVAEHVRLHQGRVWCEDRPDGRPGARFVVYLPVAAP